MNPLRCAIPAFFLLLQVLPFSPHQKLQRIAQPENAIASQFIVGFDDDLVSNATAAALGLMADCCDSEGLIIQFLESAWKAFVVRNLTDVSLSRILDYPIVQSVEQVSSGLVKRWQKFKTECLIVESFKRSSFRFY
jgi:hypothetical protein